LTCRGQQRRTDLISAGRRGEISKAMGWISPVVIARGRVGGVWELVDDTVTVTAFAKPVGSAGARRGVKRVDSASTSGAGFASR